MISDEALVAQVKSGSKKAFDELVRRYQRLVYFVIKKTIANPHEADDVFQEVFISALESITRFDPEQATFKTWLFSIVKRRISDSFRRTERIPLPASDLMEELDQGNGHRAEALSQVELSETLNSALLGLCEEQRICMVLRLVHDLSYKEIAEIAGVPVGTVKSRISIARKQLLKHVPSLMEGDVSCSVIK